MTHPTNPNPAPSTNETPQNIPAPAVPAAQAKAPQEKLERFADHSSATLPPYRPVIRRPLRYDPAMRMAAARAAAAQPPLAVVASNIITWREVAR